MIFTLVGSAHNIFTEPGMGATTPQRTLLQLLCRHCSWPTLALSMRECKMRDYGTGLGRKIATVFTISGATTPKISLQTP